ncbi:hypothetical protein ACFFX0_17110 [Citricoccus parietis]|uniref:Uncharacterized protein n=1 Tax=Citricoccus parietis TaxID=592307 RepID=A0ABV5G1M0_9MICC
MSRISWITGVSDPAIGEEHVDGTSRFTCNRCASRIGAAPSQISTREVDPVGPTIGLPVGRRLLRNCRDACRVRGLRFLGGDDRFRGVEPGAPWLVYVRRSFL